MTRNPLRPLVVLVALSAVALMPAGASARSLPTLLFNTRCAHPCTRLIGEYAVRPSHVTLSEAAGGDLKLHWSSWTATAATGAGTSTVSGMGQTTVSSITVHASVPVNGRFTRLAIAGTSGGRTFHESLKLVHVGGSPAFVPTGSG